MRVQHQGLIRLAYSVSIVALGLFTAFSHVPHAQAQCRPGEYTLQQSGTVGWVYVNGDHTVEWWAYIEGAYQWADSNSVGSNKWHADAEYMGADAWMSYGSWKTNVLGRAAAQGHTITFQQHFVAEESIEN